MYIHLHHIAWWISGLGFAYLVVRIAVGFATIERLT